MAEENDFVIQLDRVSKFYPAGKARVKALDGVSLEVTRGEFVSVIGPSGGGKTTLLNCIAGLDHPDEGEIFLNRRPISKMDDAQLTALRRCEIGFIFQFFNLLPTLTLWENVELPLLLGAAGKRNEDNIQRLLEYAGLDHRAQSFPAELSGGEMQRVAIARALVHEPSIILADEPTGNLDTENGEKILALLAQVCKDFKTTILLVTHNPQAAALGQRCFEIRDGVMRNGRPLSANPAR